MRLLRSFKGTSGEVQKVCLSIDRLITNGRDAGFLAGYPVTVDSRHILEISTEGVFIKLKEKVDETAP